MFVVAYFDGILPIPSKKLKKFMFFVPKHVTDKTRVYPGFPLFLQNK